MPPLRSFYAPQKCFNPSAFGCSQVFPHFLHSWSEKRVLTHSAARVTRRTLEHQAVIPLEVCSHQSGDVLRSWQAVSVWLGSTCGSFIHTGVTWAGEAGIRFLHIVRTGAMNYPPAQLCQPFFLCDLLPFHPFLFPLAGLKAGSCPDGNMRAAHMRSVSGDLAAQLGSLWHSSLKNSQKIVSWFESEASSVFQGKGKSSLRSHDPHPLFCASAPSWVQGAV